MEPENTIHAATRNETSKMERPPFIVLILEHFRLVTVLHCNHSVRFDVRTLGVKRSHEYE